MFRSLLAILLVVGLGAGSVSSGVSDKVFAPESLLAVQVVPQVRGSFDRPIIEAHSALLVDVGSGIRLFEKNPSAPMPIASLTKIMTAILILESHRLSEVVTVQEDFNTYKELGVRIWLQQYEKLTIGDLLIGLLVPSAGDAAIALAIHHSGSVDAFVDAMNRRAKELGLGDTHFQNPIGLDEEGHFSTAADLGILTRYALRNKDFRRIVHMGEGSIASINGKNTHSFKSTNELLGGYLDVEGVKTGTTDEAGQSLIVLARGKRGNEVLAILLDSPSRFQEGKSLIDWSFRNFYW